MQQLNDLQLRFMHTWERLCVHCFGKSQMDLPDLFNLWDKVPEIQSMSEGVDLLYNMVFRMGKHLNMKTTEIDAGIKRMDAEHE